MSITALDSFNQAWKQTKIDYIRKCLKTEKGKKKLVNELVDSLIENEEMDMETFLHHFKENLELTIDIAMRNDRDDECQKLSLSQEERFQLLDL